MSKTTPHIRRAREQKSETIWPDDKLDRQRTALPQQPDFGTIPTAARQRRDNLVGKEAARAFRERAGKRGKTPPLIRRR